MTFYIQCTTEKNSQYYFHKTLSSISSLYNVLPITALSLLVFFRSWDPYLCYVFMNGWLSVISSTFPYSLRDMVEESNILTQLQLKKFQQKFKLLEKLEPQKRQESILNWQDSKVSDYNRDLEKIEEKYKNLKNKDKEKKIAEDSITQKYYKTVIKFDLLNMEYLFQYFNTSEQIQLLNETIDHIKRLSNFEFKKEENTFLSFIYFTRLRQLLSKKSANLQPKDIKQITEIISIYHQLSTNPYKKIINTEDGKFLKNTFLSNFAPVNSGIFSFIGNFFRSLFFIESYSLLISAEMLLPGNESNRNFLKKVTDLNADFEYLRNITIEEPEYKANKAFYDVINNTAQFGYQKIVFSTALYSTFSTLVNFVKDDKIKRLMDNYLEDQLLWFNISSDAIDYQLANLTSGFVGSVSDLNNIVRSIITYYYANKKKASLWHTLFIGEKSQLYCFLYGLMILNDASYKQININESATDYLSKRMDQNRLKRLLLSMSDVDKEDYSLINKALPIFSFFNRFLNDFIEMISPSQSSNLFFYILNTANLQRSISSDSENLNDVFNSYSVMAPIDTIVKHKSAQMNLIIGYSPYSIEDPAISSRFQGVIVCNTPTAEDIFIYMRRKILRFYRARGEWITKKDFSLDYMILVLANKLQNKYQYIDNYLFGIYRYHQKKPTGFNQIIDML